MFEPLDSCHQNFMEEKLKQLPSILSEYFFPNFYIYRKSFGDKIHQGPFSIIETVTVNGQKVYTPLDPLTPESLHYYKNLVGSCVLYPIPDEWLVMLEGYSKESYEEDADYIFTLEKMAFLKGRHLSGKRNLLHQFFDLYEKREAINLAPPNIPLAKEVLASCSTEHKEDYRECAEALEKMEELHLYGRLLIIENKPVGFIVGGFQRDAFIVQFMKADKAYKGIYTFLYQDLAQALPESTAWINLEQDLGILPLRQAKKSYQPDQVATKWRVKL